MGKGCRAELGGWDGGGCEVGAERGGGGVGGPGLGWQGPQDGNEWITRMEVSNCNISEKRTVLATVIATDVCIDRYVCMHEVFLRLL